MLALRKDFTSSLPGSKGDYGMVLKVWNHQVVQP